MRAANILMSAGIRGVSASFVGIVVLFATFIVSLVFSGLNVHSVYMVSVFLSGASFVFGLAAIFLSQIMIRFAMRGIDVDRNHEMSYLMKSNSMR